MGKRKKRTVKIEIPEEGILLVNDNDTPIIEETIPTDELPPIEEEPIELVTLDVVGLEHYKMLDAISELPEPEKFSQRWYGETFLPLYTKSRNKLRKLAGLS